MHTRRILTLASSCVALALAFPAAEAQVVTSSGGEVVGSSQKTVINQLVVGDSMEVELAQLAATRSKNEAVRALANQLLTDHRAQLETLKQLAAKPSIGREASPADTSAPAARALVELKAANDSAFDAAFVTAQINHHKRALDDLKKVRAGVTDAELQQNIDKMVPAIEQHLNAAQTLAKQLAAPPADSAAKRPPR